MSLDTYAILDRETISVKPVLAHHVIILLKGIKRKINKKPKSTNPWTIKSTVNIQKDVYLKWVRAVRDFKIQFFRDITETRNKKGDLKRIEISFTHIGPLQYHLRKAVNETDKVSFSRKFFMREWSDGCKGTVNVDEENRAVMAYTVSTGKLELCVKYEVVNRYGNAF